MIDHHSLQVERPDEVADHIRQARKHIPAERAEFGAWTTAEYESWGKIIRDANVKVE